MVMYSHRDRHPNGGGGGREDSFGPEGLLWLGGRGQCPEIKSDVGARHSETLSLSRSSTLKTACHPQVITTTPEERVNPSKYDRDHTATRDGRTANRERAVSAFRVRNPKRASTESYPDT
ncbi:hypothetical protein EVAR_78223_1 [Eumeta japonica]|uniref:Uncharacterized protein n=1 Tax=Eumeta variegata TaxID=151549 RepID=A0A4C1T5T0_EUMVA|nr:hypothetical protein EVAR_78223_1 [Eumeta japonica]